MFIVVKYGDNECKLFNPNCRNKTLIENIKRRCQCQKEDVLDLSDEEGTVKNLQSKLNQYGTECMTARETLILLRVQRTTKGYDERVTYTPMLQGMETNKEFLEKINPVRSPSRVRIRSVREPIPEEKERKHRQRNRRTSISGTRRNRRGSIVTLAT